MSKQMKDAHNRAIRYLSQREHSVLELSTKLTRGDTSEQVVVAVISELQQQGLQSDARFTEQYVRSRRNRGYGPIRIQQDLKQRGVSEELIQANLHIDDIVWQEQAKQVKMKKFGKISCDEFTDRTKVMRFLQYRGFTNAQISHALGSTERL